MSGDKDARAGQDERDAALLEALAEGDREGALTDLYDRLAPSIFAVLLRLLPDRDDAEELLRDTFVELWRRAGQYRPGDGSVRTWAITLTRDRAREHLRESAGAGGEPPDVATLLGEDLDPVMPAPQSFKQLQAAVDRALDEDADNASTPAPRPSELHPATRRVVSQAKRRAARATAFATFAFAAAIAFGFMWHRERNKMSELRKDVSVASSRASSARADVLDQLGVERDQREELTTRLARLQARYGAIESPRVQLTTLRDGTGGVAKIFHGTAERRWLVLAFALPPIGDHDYQLWFMPQDGRTPVSGGVLERTEAGVLVGTPEVPDALGAVKAAISLEPKGGSKAPTSDQIKLIGDLI